MTTPTQPRAAGRAAHTLFTLPPRSSNEGWSIGTDAGGGTVRRVAENLKLDEAEQIVRRCNSHAALVAALEDSIEVMELAGFDIRFPGTLNQARAALAAAKE